MEKPRPGAVLLDITKAYPRVNRTLLWKILEKWKLPTEVIEIVKKLHEHTSYRVKGNEGLSNDSLPARGLREGCATSPILFNIYHSEAIRLAQRDRETEAAKRNLKYGLKWSLRVEMAWNDRWNGRTVFHRRTLIEVKSAAIEKPLLSVTPFSPTTQPS